MEDDDPYYAPINYDEGYTMQHGMDVTIDEQFNTMMNPHRGRVCAEVEPTTFPDNNSMGIYGDMIETFTQNGGDAETAFNFEFLMLVVFVIAVFYAVYLVFSCNTTFIGGFFELIYALMVPFVYIPYTFFVKGCPEFIWKSLGNLVGPTWNQIIAIIASFVMTMGTSVFIWLMGSAWTYYLMEETGKEAERERRANANTSSPQTPATRVANVTSAASTGIQNTASAVAA
jgi:hypothetical protein